MNPRLGEYIRGNSAAEQARLRTPLPILTQSAGRLLDAVGVGAGWQVLEVGCGPRGILDLLAERVGPAGSVVGLDRDPVFLELARSFVAEQSCTNVLLVEGDSKASGLPDGSFDFAYAQRVLINLPEPERVVDEMLRLVRPGGVVGLVEMDDSPAGCDPPHPAWDRLKGVRDAAHQQAGRWGVNGRRLPGLMRSAGLTDIEVEVAVGIHGHGEAGRVNFLATFDSSQEALIAGGFVTEQELVGLTESLRDYLDDPTVVVHSPMIVAAWGRKPASNA